MTDPKTQALRLLDQRGFAYVEVVFPETIHDAIAVAAYAGVPPGQVFKTLVVLTAPPGGRPALILEPADATLDLKRAAQAMRVKRLEMASHAQAEQLTGLKVGGISALALTHKRWPVFLDRRRRTLGDNRRQRRPARPQCAPARRRFHRRDRGAVDRRGAGRRRDAA